MRTSQTNALSEAPPKKRGLLYQPPLPHPLSLYFRTLPSEKTNPQLQNVPGYNFGTVTLSKAEHVQLCPTSLRAFLLQRSAEPARASKLQATITNVDKLNPKGYANGQLLISKVQVEAE